MTLDPRAKKLIFFSLASITFIGAVYLAAPSPSGRVITQTGKRTGAASAANETSPIARTDDRSLIEEYSKYGRIAAIDRLIHENGFSELRGLPAKGGNPVFTGYVDQLGRKQWEWLIYEGGSEGASFTHRVIEREYYLDGAPVSREKLIERLAELVVSQLKATGKDVSK